MAGEELVTGWQTVAASYPMVGEHAFLLSLAWLIINTTILNHSIAEPVHLLTFP